MQIGDRIKELQDRAGLRAKDVCTRSGLTTSTYSQYVNNVRQPGHDNIIKIAKAFEPDLGDVRFYLVTGESLSGLIKKQIGEGAHNMYTKEQVSEVFHEVLKDFVSVDAIEFKYPEGINQLISVINKRMDEKSKDS